MRRIVLGLIIALSFTGEALPQGGCGLVPLKPLPPLGCKDLVPRCVCEQSGRNCRWVWDCVR